MIPIQGIENANQIQDRNNAIPFHVVSQVDGKAVVSIPPHPVEEESSSSFERDFFI